MASRTRFEKLRSALCDRPSRSGARFSDVKRLLETAGFEHRRTRGSHHRFVHPELRHDDATLGNLTIVDHGGMLRAVYVKYACAAVDYLADLGRLP